MNSTQPFQMAYHGAPVNNVQIPHQQQMVHNSNANQSLDGSVFFDIDDEDVDFNVFELTESNINAAVINTVPTSVHPAPQQPLKNHRSSGAHGINLMMNPGMSRG
jgi:hypothetical protein